ncbi:MAG: tetratricopeptide repeat protein [Myxococcales bacterium]|nr:tetratricopeptide repeat protein [Myxococcales bacterium]
MRSMRWLVFPLLLCPGALRAQTGGSPEVATLIARGDSLDVALEPMEALAQYKAALTAAPTSYAALWRAARSQVDVAKTIKGDHPYTRSVRDSVYSVAQQYAEQAIAADSMGADGHFALALVLGQLSRTRSGKERVSFARQIYDASARALALNPDHDGAEHIIGAWHAEIKRLSGITKFFARTFLGAGFMDRAAWDSAVVHLERSVAIRPDYVHHHLELAEVLVDLERYAEARRQLELIPSLPDGDVLDPDYRAAAAELLARIRNK